MCKPPLSASRSRLLLKQTNIPKLSIIDQQALSYHYTYLFISQTAINTIFALLFIIIFIASFKFYPTFALVYPPISKENWWGEKRTLFTVRVLSLLLCSPNTKPKNFKSDISFIYSINTKDWIFIFIHFIVRIITHIYIYCIL